MILAAFTALWLGILATLSPCPLASNVAALSCVIRPGNPREALIQGGAYGAGRFLTHLLLGALLVGGLLDAPDLYRNVLRILAKAAGPLFLVVGALLLEWLTPHTGGSLKKALAERIPPNGPGAFLLGVLLSLLPCPETAALFFGGLLPLAAREGSSLLLPGLFGLGAALPVALAGWGLSAGTQVISRRLRRIDPLETLLRHLTGVAFLGVGFYFTLTHVYRLF
ncbi:cytochrome c biogenesis protein, transmembrane region [Aminomonas paucivorans DSM 12260]|uniref:Cytochrome c biogenesis protein, transmembrane region n=1 Tax=Aminomonas paucivorans DSM 12260 TaxID=584708 RepID=E3CVQ1_9BACT|nr:sulfite exporter TauE/SafE family protein [Aminomonas paucivorans]EFQ23252.1 cytochrome c biogenesis protein, transmembrane region [Aminomonas paucivorans DSM 12260]